MAVSLGHNEVVWLAVSEDADLSQIGCEVVPTSVLLCWLGLSADDQLATPQLLLFDLDNLAKVLDPRIDVLQFSLGGD